MSSDFSSLPSKTASSAHYRRLARLYEVAAILSAQMPLCYWEVAGRWLHHRPQPRSRCRLRRVLTACQRHPTGCGSTQQSV
jgi:hypothetical protein